MIRKLEEFNKEEIGIVAKILLKASVLQFPLKFVGVESGPRVTNYIFQAAGTGVLSKITNRAPDIAFTIGVRSVIISVDFDKIIIAVPNEVQEVIKFDQLINWLFMNKELSSIKLPILMGQNAEGQNQILDLAIQPHMLIAGSTGSGKSVFLAQIISSLALRLSPKELEFYLVDTKQLDLTLFENLSHTKKLITKVIDLHDTLEQLLVIVRQRADLIRANNCRNISQYNELKSNLSHSLSYIVLVIDELADVLDQDKELAKEEDKDAKRTRIKDSLKQLAQISRASGLHIIAATQRPSVQVLGGDTRANFQCRISFRLPSAIDSRVVLGNSGAEQLLGRGDYLFQSVEDNTLRRGHSSYVSIEDVSKLVEQHEFIRDMYKDMAEQAGQVATGRL